MSTRSRRRMRHAAVGVTASIATLAMVFPTGSAAAHPHEVETGNGETVVIANGQNHPGFVEDENGLFESCEGVAPSDNDGPAGYGLETAHHGPDAGTPGKADGCFATDGPPQDNNPAID